jgi:hypothetical protein
MLDHTAKRIEESRHPMSVRGATLTTCTLRHVFAGFLGGSIGGIPQARGS